MNRWRVIIATLAAILLSSSSVMSWSGASGVHSVIALFESHVHPDLPLDRFVAGRIGIIKPTWDHSYLYVAYRYLAGPGFDAGEQKALVSMLNERLDLAPSGDMASEPLDPQRLLGVAAQTTHDTDRASAAWIAARNKVPGVSTIEEIGVYREAPAEFDSFYFANCNESAFNTAATTLESMIEKFGLPSSQVKQWVDAQDQVFQNCSPGFSTNDSEPPKLTVQGVSSADAAPSTAPSAPQIPQSLTNGTPFERAQRTYQIASANFYSGNFDTAAKMFAAIAADTSSPWRHLAPYLVARATIRKATLSSEKNDHVILAQAEALLNEIVSWSIDETVKRDAKRLLGFVQAQLHPEEREQELARAVMLSTTGDIFKQDVSDYLWMLDHGPGNANSYSDDLTDWISTLHEAGSSANPPAPYSDTSAIAHSLDNWKKTSSLPWLVAAISEVSASDPNVPALIKAADSIKPDSPGFATLTYHIARLMSGQGKIDDARGKLDAILASRDELPVSTVNEFKALRMGLARNLNELLADAPRTPLGFTDDADSEELPSNLDEPNAQPLKALASEPLFDDDGAAVLTRWVPFSVQIEAAHSSTLPPNLRAQVALTVFVKAILLGNEPAARDLAPAVMESFPKLKPSIDAWLAAKNPDAQRFAAAFMMLQNPGMRFYVDPGPGRSTGLGEIDSLRDNWWPSLVTQNLKNETYPGFLSATEKKSADDEWQKLSAINAPNFLCTEAIDQSKSHPNDDRAPEALYQCTRAVHLGCTNSKSDDLAKSAFLLLHHRYSDSPWAQKGKLWYKGDGSCGGSDLRSHADP